MKPLLKPKAVAVWVLIALVAVFAVWMAVGMVSRIPGSPEAAVKVFYGQDAAEDQLMDPLILAGPAVIPLLARDLKRPDMPRRRYAIGALGNMGSKSAIGVLEPLVRAASEPGYIRCDALAAIAMVSEEEGKRLANEVALDTRHGCLSEIAAGLNQDYDKWVRTSPQRRTYLQALLGRHD